MEFTVAAGIVAVEQGDFSCDIEEEICMSLRRSGYTRSDMVGSSLAISVINLVRWSL
jgi:hypothetical protein